MSERKAIFTITERDVVNAMKLASSKKLAIPIPAILGIGGALAAFAMYYFRGETNFTTDYLVPILIILLFVVAVVQYALLPWQARRHFRQSAMLRDEVTIEWDTEEFRVSGKHGQMNIAWTELHRWSENDAALLLYQSELLFHMVPKRALGQGKAHDLIGQIVAAGVKKR